MRVRCSRAVAVMVLVTVSALGGAWTAARGQAPPAQQEVGFPSSDFELRGFIWRPEGAGPFPAVLWNHGSEKLPGWLPDLGPAFVRRGYAFFIPHRRGHGRSPGPYI